jgi:hypothetical protein
MHLDSQIMMAVTVALIEDGIPSVPVHDSIIVPARFEGQAKAIMIESWERFSGTINSCVVK